MHRACQILSDAMRAPLEQFRKGPRLSKLAFLLALLPAGISLASGAGLFWKI